MKTSCFWIAAFMLAPLFANNATATEPYTFSEELYTDIKGHHEFMYGNIPYADGTLTYLGSACSRGGTAEAMVSTCDNYIQATTSISGSGNASAYGHYADAQGSNTSVSACTVSNSHVTVTSSSTTEVNKW
jgi:hypothetical protein